MRASPEITLSAGAMLASLVTRIDHIAVAVTNLDEAIHWYTLALGFKLIEERTTEGAHTAMRSAVLSAGQAIIVLIQGLSPQSQVSRFIERYGPGVQHVALEVTNIEQAIKRVNTSGGDCDTTLIEGEGIRQTFLRRDEGSGVRVELVERRGGTFSDTTVSRLFREFEAKDLV